MVKRPVRPIAPPVDSDKSLHNYTAVLKYNLDELFALAHNHAIKTPAPADTEGSVGDICLVEASGAYKIYAKFRGGWKSATLS